MSSVFLLSENGMITKKYISNIKPNVKVAYYEINKRLPIGSLLFGYLITIGCVPIGDEILLRVHPIPLGGVEPQPQLLREQLGLLRTPQRCVR